MKVKTVSEFLGIPKDTIGEVVNQDGSPLPEGFKPSTAMWIKFDCKDMPVGICQDFSNFIIYED
jgi:hypothetical protein